MNTAIFLPTHGCVPTNARVRSHQHTDTFGRRYRSFSDKNRAIFSPTHRCVPTNAQVRSPNAQVRSRRRTCAFRSRAEVCSGRAGEHSWRAEVLSAECCCWKRRVEVRSGIAGERSWRAEMLSALVLLQEEESRGAFTES